MPLLNLAKISALSGEEMLTALEQEAVKNKISDIHITPEKNMVRIEWRELGVLTKLFDVTPAVYDTLQRRIKFKSKLKLNLETIAQDGQYTFSVGGRIVNVRVASLPTRFGEAFTLRFLDPEHGIVPLEQLGFPKEIKDQLTKLVDLPNGLVLVTGPTGSGKTTTLYALLSMVAGKERNIVTLEDPIEYELPHIVQSQVDPEHGYTFATGLRAVLRHDPDIVLVGEIRDKETAQTAIDASLTGHLVLATLHTNSAIEAIPRLLSMGVNTYTFAPALRGVLAQRLVRTVDPAAPKAGEPVYSGQKVVPELLLADETIRSMILKDSTTAEILAQARKQGYKTMKEWGEEMIAAGVTTKEEVMRVTAE